MSRIASLRRRPPGLARAPRRGGMGGDPFAEREPFRDPRGAGHHSTLPYREAVELLRCLEIMGPRNDAYCRHEVLGEPMPPPEFETAAGISSPVPFGAAAGRGGRRTAQIGAVAVTLLPDARSADKKMKGRAETSIKFNKGGITWTTNRAGEVTRINGPPPVTATIRTTYGLGVKATSTSGYGRGTTAEDVAAGNTSLGFHEGRHGVDFLRYLANHPFPEFTGRKGMTGDDVKAAAEVYRDAREAYVTDLNRVSTENSDCVGDTASVSDEVRVICDAKDAAAVP